MRKAKVLLVDDELIILKFVTKRLQLNNYEVETAIDGEEALEKVKSFEPEVIVLDVMLPKMNGYQVCALLKKDARYATIPIILFTAKTQERDKQLGLECGADAYVCKPFRTEELLSKIEALLPKESHHGKDDTSRG